MCVYASVCGCEREKGFGIYIKGIKQTSHTKTYKQKCQKNCYKRFICQHHHLTDNAHMLLKQSLQHGKEEQ